VIEKDEQQSVKTKRFFVGERIKYTGLGTENHPEERKGRGEKNTRGLQRRTTHSVMGKREGNSRLFGEKKAGKISIEDSGGWGKKKKT